MRIACGIAYQGESYYGWQRQANGLPTIQESVETALSRIADEPIETYCAGRTDAGVHACYQVIHFDTLQQRPIHAWILGTNAYLPHTIRVLWAVPVASDFHARYSAQARQYRYYIDNQRIHSPFYQGRSMWIPYPLNVATMHDAAQHLIGEHDFSAFRDSDCQSQSPHRHLKEVSVSYQHNLIVIEIMANAFLHHMVRNIVGVLVEIGRGREAVAWSKTVLDSRDRRQASVTMPACGLYLTDVRYPEIFALPSTVAITPWRF